MLETIWPAVASALLEADVSLRCDQATLAALDKIGPAHSRRSTDVQAAQAADFDTEHLSKTISVKAVPTLQAAISFINAHSSHHTDVIVTELEAAASIFVRGVDSAGTFWNASSRFADGFRYGFGTEVGISTGRVHARGPVGLEGLMIYKYVLRSKNPQGSIIGEFGVAEGKKKYKHAPISADALPF